MSELINYINNDWKDNYITRKFITDYIFLLNNSFILWSLKLQKFVVINFCEVKYMTLKKAFKELI